MPDNWEMTRSVSSKVAECNGLTPACNRTDVFVWANPHLWQLAALHVPPACSFPAGAPKASVRARHATEAPNRDVIGRAKQMQT
eukprot:CAMPEP_0179052192 /NCGR_PEP_ID=MMETSP0796-20121207/21632_1 /TAXON_ID=73915 /ORGANISM="Pyrodinium bahamense, Strain pbaha01" /LENGTH=83 /DNA_ID=CAMNT_0020748753 /DNA_START=26 /DNA_END=277 /DNA_ORIENTATION=+